MDIVTVIISVIALSISGYTFYLTKFKLGQIRITRPSLICLLGRKGSDAPKIFLRTLLYSTSERGQYIQHMYIDLRHKGNSENFNVWSYGDQDLVYGSGLYIDKKGFSSNHHFLHNSKEWAYSEGDYEMVLFEETVGRKIRRIFNQRLSLTKKDVLNLRQGGSVYFEWSPIKKNYIKNSKEGVFFF